MFLKENENLNGIILLLDFSSLRLLYFLIRSHAILNSQFSTKARRLYVLFLNVLCFSIVFK